MTDSPLQLRPLHPRDHAYIYDSWFKSLRDTSPTFRHVPIPVYTHHMPKIIEHHLEASEWLVLAGNTHKDWCTGYVCGTFTEASTAIHMVYVRKSYREHGLASQLIQSLLDLGPPTEMVYYSNVSLDTMGWQRKHTPHIRNQGLHWLGRRWLHNPWALTYMFPEDWFL